METVTATTALRAWHDAERKAGRTIAFVPTMGALHAGHRSLLARAGEVADRVVLSVFVNPAQFGPSEDFEAYPRDPEGDAGLAAAAGASLLFAPDRDQVYPPGFATYVRVEGLEDRLCGRFRPGHFRGVATVVARLLGLVAPDYLLLGEKDFQQLVLLRRMVRDLALPVAVLGCPTVREADGLALSSRNVYLSAGERRAATALSRALAAAADRFAGGERRRDVLVATMRDVISAEPMLRIEYAELVDPERLTAAEPVSADSRAVLAVYAGRTRLIDNRGLGAQPPGER